MAFLATTKKNQVIWQFDKPFCNEYLVLKIKNESAITKSFLPKKIFDCIFKYKKNPKFKPLFYEDNFRLKKNIHSKNIKILEMGKSEIITGKKILNKYGISDSDLVCCLIIRDKKYLSEKESTLAEQNHHFRNVELKTYLPSLKYLCEKKVFVLRMGQNQETKIPFQNNFFIDYAFQKWRSEFLDLFLAWRCDFCISTSTGWDELVKAYKKPILFTNFYPLAYLPTYADNSIIMFKKFYDIKQECYLSLQAIKRRRLWFGLPYNLQNQSDIRVVDNTSEEILEGTKELFEKIRPHKLTQFVNTRQQRRFWQIFPKSIRDPKSKYRLHSKIRAQISNRFLAINKEILV